MFGSSTHSALAIASALIIGCSSVSGADPDMWQPAQGIGTQVQFVPDPSAGAAGMPMPPPTGTNPIPPGAGGIPNFGGNPNFGGTPTAGIPNFGGGPPIGGAPPFGGFPPSNGGDPNVAGFPNIGGAPVGTGGDPNVPPPPPPPPLTGKCNFTFDVTTKSYGGRFRPKNVGAIYIVNGAGAYVKSLNVWGGTRLGNLTDWQTLSGGNKTDAVTSATRSNAGPISGHWDCTQNGAVVPAGQYQVCCSFQEDDALPFFGPAPKKACVPFDLPPATSSMDAPDQQYFTGMHISIQ